MCDNNQTPGKTLPTIQLVFSFYGLVDVLTIAEAATYMVLNTFALKLAEAKTSILPCLVFAEFARQQPAELQ